MRRTWVYASGVFALACLRLCFAGVLWSDEDYHMAAAIHMLHGHLPYRDFWYDKPPLAALYYLAIGGFPGLILRCWDAAYILLCCRLAFQLARSRWGGAEGWAAALLMAFFTTFYLPASVIPFAPDALLLAPHFAAIYFASRSKPLLAGLVCGLGFWINVKALFVAAACTLWAWGALPAFAGTVGAGAALLGALGMAAGYWEQVWVWGLAYAPGAPVAHPWALSLGRIANWLGFHAALAASWIAGIWREEHRERWRLTAWLGFSFAAVCLGNHFAPRYFLQMLPPLTVIGGRGLVLAFAARRRLAAVGLALLLLVPLVRFAPRYLRMAVGDRQWTDIALNADSQEVAARINMLARPTDTLFVWGYRPDVYVYTRLNIASKFWDSQPLTGIAADRHLAAFAPHANAQTSAHLLAVERARPTFIVDGLGRLNERLKPANFAEMRQLLRSYREVARTKLSVIYRRFE